MHIYSQFITHLKELEKAGLDSNEGIEKHHILPIHAGGKDGPVVYCSSANHTLAHFYRFLIFKEKGDWVAYAMRKNQKTNCKDRSLLGVEARKKMGLGFWDSEFQKKQGSKGGKKGGLANTLKQKAARSKVGFEWGRNTGVQNQRPCLKKILSKQTIWFYEDESFAFYAAIPPQKTFSALADILDFLLVSVSQIRNLPFKSKINKSSFFKVLYGQRLKMYGWKLFFIKF